MGAKITLQGDNRTQRAINGAIAGLKRMGRAAVAVGAALRSVGSHAARAMRSVAIGAGVAVAASALLVRQFMAAQKSEAMLADSLARTGDATQANIARFKELAKSIQATTAVDGDAIIEQIALAKNMGIATDQLELAARAAVGLAARYKIDLASAMKLIAKANAGNTETLTRYGIQIDKTLSKQDQFNSLLMIGAASFTFAEREATTLSGRIQQVRNSFGDTLETLGGLITKIFRLEDRFGSLAKVFDAINERLENVNVAKWAKRATEAINTVKEAALNLGGILLGLAQGGKRMDILRGIGAVIIAAFDIAATAAAQALLRAAPLIGKLIGDAVFPDRARKREIGDLAKERGISKEAAEQIILQREGQKIALQFEATGRNLSVAINRLEKTIAKQREQIRDLLTVDKPKPFKPGDLLNEVAKKEPLENVSVLLKDILSGAVKPNETTQKDALLISVFDDVTGDIVGSLASFQTSAKEASKRQIQHLQKFGNAATAAGVQRLAAGGGNARLGFGRGALSGGLTRLESDDMSAAKDAARMAGFSLRGLPEIPKGGMIGLTSEMGTKNNPMYVAQTDEVI